MNSSIKNKRCTDIPHSSRHI